MILEGEHKKSGRRTWAVVSRDGAPYVPHLLLSQPYQALDDQMKMHTKLLGLLSLGAFVFAHGHPPRPQKTCNVPAIGGGEDDGPAILAAFKECSRNAKIVLDKYYVVDTLLLTKDLENVQIELSGTGEYCQFYSVTCVPTEAHGASPVYA